MSTNEALLVSRRERGWRMGLGSMLGKELAAWWKTRRWWLQCLVALLVLNGGLAVSLKTNEGPAALQNATIAFLMTAALCVPVAATSMRVFPMFDRIFDTTRPAPVSWSANAFSKSSRPSFEGFTDGLS